MGGCASRPKAKGDDLQPQKARCKVPVSPKKEDAETVTNDQTNKTDGGESPSVDVSERAATEAEKPKAAQDVEKTESDSKAEAAET